LDNKKKTLLGELEHVALSAALRAADILRKGFYSDLIIEEKTGIHDVVTQFDKKAEEIIISSIRTHFPNHSFVGEEGGTQGSLEAPVIWVIDPIDGTWNFSRQIPAFAISIAAFIDKKPALAICLDPIANELFIGKLGGGAAMNGRPLVVSSIATLTSAGISLGGCVGMSNICHISQIRRTGSAVLDLCYVAKGALDGYIEWELNLWDFAAASLLVEEAGGKVTTLKGNPITIDFGKTSSIVASNGKIHEDLINWISTVEK
jgi:myo-inositol-1(or 4)-monophosphatase